MLFVTRNRSVPLSMLLGTHAPPQKLLPPGHDAPHLLALQVAVPPPVEGAGQTLPQVPQFLRSLARATHVLPHTFG